MSVDRPGHSRVGPRPLDHGRFAWEPGERVAWLGDAPASERRRCRDYTAHRRPLFDCRSGRWTWSNNLSATGTSPTLIARKRIAAPPRPSVPALRRSSRRWGNSGLGTPAVGCLPIRSRRHHTVGPTIATRRRDVQHPSRTRLRVLRGCEVSERVKP